ncbi:GntR family transcriptional regulator [Scopulibacillus cellulosilyticus]|uniref:GntR family transcriptional regulator n=1 Tax=Scopulibacillus cellulosilyticus TaxID=2665665 RepID=A0ABW2Q136_9BACL
MEINKDLPTPLYYQVQEILEDKIISGEWAEGYQLQTEKELAKLYNVSTITVKRALQELVNKGKLYRVRGKGTFVSKQVKENNIFNVVTFGTENEEVNPHKLLHYSIGKAEKTVAKKLDLSERDQLIHLIRLKFEDEVPAALEFSYLVYDLCPNFSPLLTEKDLIYNVVQENDDVQLEKVKIHFSTISANDYEADLLQIEEGTPLIVLERVTYADKGRPVEYSKFIIRQDKANYYIEFNLK